MLVIGISMSHDGTLTVLKDGKRIFSLAEERINRKKAYIGFPFAALRYAIERKVFDPSKVDAIAISTNQFLRRHHWTHMFSLTENKLYFDFINDEQPAGFRLPKYQVPKSDEDAHNLVFEKLSEIFSGYKIKAPIHFVEHHECHVASAYYSSGFTECLAITMDGEGDGLSATVSTCINGVIQRISSTPVSGSAGYLYSEVTKMCGFRANRHEGKITGLAAYGNYQATEDQFDNMSKVVDGKLVYNLEKNISMRQIFMRRLVKILGRKASKFLKISRPNRARELLNEFGHLSREDLSASIQNHLEKRIVEKVHYWVEKTGISDIVFSGGIFANVKFNQKISELHNVRKVFIYPDMGDGGNAYGAAEILSRRLGPSKFKPEVLKHIYFGPSFTNQDVAKMVSQFSDQLRVVKEHSPELVAAAYLAEQKIVGWFQGAMEYGPRALGNRSILASATDASVNFWLNQRMKRNEFMPFAPSCLYECADEVFHIPHENYKYPAQFMTITFKMKDEWISRAPAVAHIDGTARPQLVLSDANPRYHALLKEYKRLTGIPLVVNTSFNVHEEPIVCQPREGLVALVDGVIDVFICEDNIITRLCD